MSNQERTPASSAFGAEITVGPGSAMGDKLRALRISRKMTVAALSRATGLSDRAIRYIENNERQPGVDAVKKLSAALNVGTDYFMDDGRLRGESWKEDLLTQAKQKYGSRGMAQARQLYESAKAFYAGDQLNEQDREAFRDLMMELFFETKEEAKKYIPKKYRK